MAEAINAFDVQMSLVWLHISSLCRWLTDVAWGICRWVQLGMRAQSSSEHKDGLREVHFGDTKKLLIRVLVMRAKSRVIIDKPCSAVSVSGEGTVRYTLCAKWFFGRINRTICKLRIGSRPETPHTHTHTPQRTIFQFSSHFRQFPLAFAWFRFSHLLFVCSTFRPFYLPINLIFLYISRTSSPPSPRFLVSPNIPPDR